MLLVVLLKIDLVEHEKRRAERCTSSRSSPAAGAMGMYCLSLSNAFANTAVAFSPYLTVMMASPSTRQTDKYVQTNHFSDLVLEKALALDMKSSVFDISDLDHLVNLPNHQTGCHR